LLFARATDDPAASDALLHAMRRQLRAEFCREEPAAPAVRAESGNDFLRPA
jgi:hypothetical protein